MFDNNMNNNQNFNNGNSQFNNNFNNQFDNNQNQYNNYGTQPLNQNFMGQQMFNPQQNFNEQNNNIFNADSFNNDINISSISENDVPPDLPPIKNLSDATVSSAPTMDVLGPMNIMPETLPTSNDPLDAYENGNINLNNNGMFNQNVEPSFVTPNIQNNFNNDSLNQSMLDNNTNIYPSWNENIYNPQNQNIESTSMPYNGYQPSNGLSNNEYDISNYNTINQPTSIVNQTELNDFNNNTTGSQNSFENPVNDYKTEESNQDYTIDQSIINDEQQLESRQDKEEPKEDNIKEYDILQEESLNEEKKEEEKLKETSINDLGLDESYTEPDTLEIMDFENEEDLDEPEEKDEAETSQKEEITIEPGSISKNVERIKALLEEIKSSGIDLELEEFDFETMYQLIIKINK
ncbi:MAG: hypothetical protein ACI4U0_06175 [Candidatus Aphodocola sp.]